MNVSDNEFDQILNEIDKEQNEKSIQEKNPKNEYNVDWNEIMDKIRERNTNYIKNLISSKQIGVNAQHPNNGRTLLMFAVIIGNLDLVKAICNAGSDVSIKDVEGLDALDYALKFGHYKITELVFYRTLSGKTGNDLKKIATAIHAKNKEAEYMKKQKIKILTRTGRFGNAKEADMEVHKIIIGFTINAIKERAPFDPSILFYAWHFNEDSLTSPLWSAMMETFEQILSDTKDKNGWKWLKEKFLNSLIWFLPHPNIQKDEKKENEEDAMESTLQRTLFYELLKRVRIESKKQSDLLLRDEINAIKKEQSNDWQQLIKYDVLTKQSSNARQDAYIEPLYKEHELSEDKFPPSTHFSAKKFYDTSIYLNNLMFTANILDDRFQSEMMRITKEIGTEINEKVMFRMGPVKTLSRSQTKVENDYIAEKWPKSAKILDINRCALQFKTVNALMKFLKNFEVKVKNGTTGSITEIIRCKNGWSVYNEQLPSYTDIKLNVLIQSKEDETKSIIAEIQLLLDVMSAYKKIAHKLYAIERKYELVANYQLIADKMDKFDDLNEKSIETAKRLIQKADFVAFEVFESCLSTSFDRFLDKNLLQFFNLWKNECLKVMKCIILNKEMSNGNKCKALTQLLNIDLPSNFKETLNALKQECTDKYLLDSFFVIFNVWKYSLINERFDCLTLKAAKSNKSVFKFVEGSVSLCMHGKHDDGALGLGKNIKKTDSPKLCSWFTQFAASSKHCLAIDSNHRVFVWGKNDNYQLGLGDKENRYIPTLLSLFDQKAIKVAVGRDHSLILIQSGLVYSFGNGSQGRLGHSNEKSVKTPKLISSICDIHIVHVCAGSNHSMLITEDGKMYAFGNNWDGQCGLGKQMKEVSTPTIVKMPDSIFVSYAECGSNVSVILSSNGTVFSCGYSSNNGHGYIVYKANAIKALETEVISSLAVGNFHTLCLNEKRQVWSFGYGHGDKESQYKPKQIEYFSANNIEIGSVYAGIDQSVAVSVDKNELYVWGDSKEGIGAIRNVPERMNLFKNANIVSVGMGSSFIGILNETKEESKENEILLKSGQEMTVQNKKSHNVYIQNKEIFGDDEWMKIEQRFISLPFPYFSNKFVENLVMNKEQTMIELIDKSEIDTIYRSDIIESQFFLSLEAVNIIQTDQNKKEFLANAQKFKFSKIDEIAFGIPDNAKNANIYAQPKNAESIYLLKKFRL